MNVDADIAIVGAGPAGLAAGILARQRGLQAVLLEASRFPRQRPGETLHPGTEAVLRELGVLDAVESLAVLRPAAQSVEWGSAPATVPYGHDDRGEWRAFQVRRSDFDRVLRDRFRSLDGVIVQPARQVVPLIEEGRVAGVHCRDLTVRAPVTIDASGANGVLRRSLGIPMVRYSRRLLARYGYRRGRARSMPHLVGDASGWAWVAQVEPELVAWVRLDIPATTPLHRAPPAQVLHLPDAGGSGSADVTWRRASRFAGPGYYLAGEAAMVLDPSNSHGVLRALMAGMMAAHSAAETASACMAPEVSANAYAQWLGAWFERDVHAMLNLYARISIDMRAPRC